MPYSNDPKDYMDDEMYNVAELHYTLGMTYQEIENKYGITCEKAIALCQAARRRGIVHTAVMPSNKMDGPHLRELAKRLCKEFNLLHCEVVHGRKQMLTEPLSASVREGIVDRIARSAATHLELQLNNLAFPCLAITCGILARKLSDYVLPRKGFSKKTLVVTAQGIRTLREDRFDASTIVRDLARQLNSDYVCLPIPAAVRESEKETISNLKPVRAVSRIMDTQVNIVVGTLASHHDVDLASISAATSTDSEEKEEAEENRQTLLFSAEEVKDVVENHQGIGEFGGWWWNAEGDTVPTKSVIIGLGIQRMKILVKQKKPVILAVGGDASRIPALYAALRCAEPIGNILITDAITAEVLLNEETLQRDDIKWREPDKAVMSRWRTGIVL